jgi:hypothetical protein
MPKGTIHYNVSLKRLAFSIPPAFEYPQGVQVSTPRYLTEIPKGTIHYNVSPKGLAFSILFGSLVDFNVYAMGLHIGGVDRPLADLTYENFLTSP